MGPEIKIEKLEQTIPGKETEPLPEAPVSVHIDGYYKGFHVGITQRDSEMQDETYSLLKNAKDLISLMEKDGWDPSWNKETNRQIRTNAPTQQVRQPEVENPYEGTNTVCTFHNKAMKERKGKGGAVFYSHARKVGDTWQYCVGKGHFTLMKPTCAGSHRSGCLMAIEKLKVVRTRRLLKIG